MGRKSPAEDSHGDAVQPVRRKMLVTSDAAKYCDSSPSTFAKFRRKRGGPIFVRIGRRILYRQDDLDAWLVASRYTHDRNLAASSAEHLSRPSTI